MKLLIANIEDHQRLTYITRQSKAYWNYDIEQLKKWESDLLITPEYIEQNKVYKLIEEDSIIAYYSLETDNQAFILLQNLFVLPLYIGQGLGKFLLEKAVQKAIELGYKKMRLEADPNATNFYLKMGFKIIEQKESSIPNRFLPIMEKDLCL